MDAEAIIGSSLNNPDDEILFVKKLRAAGLTDKQIEDVAIAIDSTCGGCFDCESGECHCSNDE